MSFEVLLTLVVVTFKISLLRDQSGFLTVKEFSQIFFLNHVFMLLSEILNSDVEYGSVVITSSMQLFEDAVISHFALKRKLLREDGPISD